MGSTLIERVMSTGSLVIRKLGRDRAGEIAIHRFLSAPSVTTVEIVETLAGRTAAACAGRRIATVVLRAGPIVISRLRHDGDRSDPPQLTLHMVDAREINGAAGGQPLLWRLLTTLDVASAADAQEIVRLYRLRCRIEKIFRALKSDGMRLEKTKMEEAERLFKLALIGLVAATRTLPLVDAFMAARAPRPMFLMPTCCRLPKPLLQPAKAKLRVSKIPSRATCSPGSSLVSADGTATTNPQAPRPCTPDGPNSPPWPQDSSSLQNS